MICGAAENTKRFSGLDENEENKVERELACLRNGKSISTVFGVYELGGEKESS